jgi:hypothetical protein
MGNSSGKPISSSSETLYNDIQNTVKDLIYRYNFWTKDKENVCDNLTIVYYDKLIQYQKSDLLNASASIGLKHDINVDKGKLCVDIIKHFENRIKLLTEIWDAVDACYRKIMLSRTGPVCRNIDKYVDNFFVCKEMKGIWLNVDQYDKVLKNMKLSGQYGKWLSHVQKLDNTWNKYMKQLLRIITLIKQDVDNSMDDKEFEELRLSAKSTMDKMKYVTDVHYLLVVNFA